MSQDKDVVLSVRNVTKDFYLPHQSSNSLKETITQMFKPRDKGGDMYHALKGLSFDIKKGDFFGVVGRNGAGKSTLLRILAEIYKPTSGSVHVKGKLVPFIELGVGFNNNLSGRQNVYLNGAMLGFSKKEMDDRYDSIVEFAELEKFMDQKLKNYSSGMRVRLAFSVAIQADADILLLDEVLAVGDADFKKKCFAYFDSLKESNKTIIFVSHGMSAIREYCNRAILIEDGKIAYEGNAEDVADRYMQLFADKNEHSQKKDSLSGSKDRWGSRKVFIESFDLDKTDEKLKMQAAIVCGDKPINSVQMKVEVKNKQGKVLATFDNITVEDGQELDFKRGEKKKITFDMDNIYKGGGYSVTVTLADEDVEVYDEWNNIATFSSTAADEDRRYHVVNPGRLSVKSVSK